MPFFQNQNWPSDKKRNLLFIDLELTGLDSRIHEIIEVAALLVDPLSHAVLNSYYTKVKPDSIGLANPDSLKIANYSPSEWQEAISLREMLIDLQNLSEQVILAGWSVNTEYEFLCRALEKEKLPYFFDNYLLEVWSLAYVKTLNNSEVPKTNLANLCKYFNIPIQRHRPDSDIRATFEIFRRLVA